MESRKSRHSSSLPVRLLIAGAMAVFLLAFGGHGAMITPVQADF